jgi:hypothetical protein
MHCSSFTRSTVVALLITGACGLAAGAAAASPGAGSGGTAEAVGPVVQGATHQPKEWHWQGGWWRQGPWADHGIRGIVTIRPRPTTVFLPWGAQRLHYCAAKYPSFDPATGTYTTRRGQRRICR